MPNNKHGMKKTINKDITFQTRIGSRNGFSAIPAYSTIFPPLHVYLCSWLLQCLFSCWDIYWCIRLQRCQNIFEPILHPCLHVYLCSWLLHGCYQCLDIYWCMFTNLSKYRFTHIYMHAYDMHLHTYVNPCLHTCL